MFLNELEKQQGYYNRGRVAKLNNETPVRKDAAPRTHHKQMPYPCGWCQNGSRHSRANCPREPAPYSCFDCLAPGALKGPQDAKDFVIPDLEDTLSQSDDEENGDIGRIEW